MTQARSPNLPAADAPGQGQRLLTGLRELERTLVSSGVFLQRPALEQIVIPRNGVQATLAWGVLNRVQLPASATVQLPRIRPEFVGAPLELVLMDSSHTLTLSPAGLGADRKTRPLINGAASEDVSTVGLYSLRTDGQNWFLTQVASSGGTGDVVGPAGAVDADIAVFDGTTGKLLKDGGVTVASLATFAALYLLFFGDGSDGALSASSGTTTLSKDTYYSDVTLSGTAKIVTNGYRLLISGTLDITAAGADAINWTGTVGSAASGSTAGSANSALTGNTIGGGGAGNGGASGNNGSGGNGSNGANQSPANGGGGGAGGAGGINDNGTALGGSGGTGGTATGGVRLARVTDIATKGTSFLLGGAGGGGGGAGGGIPSFTGGGGGGGGASGGRVWIAARKINRGASTAAGAISSLGGAGGVGGIGNSTVRVNGGGGGGAGGGGGELWVLAGELLGSAKAGALSAVGGTGGTGGNASSTTGSPFGAGGNGGNGGAGGAIFLINLAASTITSTAPGTAGASGTAGTHPGTTNGIGGAGGAGGASSLTL